MTMFAESLRAFLKPVVPLLDDPDVSEILINGPREVWIEKRGRLSRTECVFTEEGLLAAARNMAQFVGRPLTEERPRLDARLPDGSRIHVVLGPVARKGTTISIRKFFAERLSMQKLVEFGSVTEQMVRLLRAAIELRLNVVVAGGTGSGKTSLLNALSSMIAPYERILTIEDSAELQLGQPHLVTLESRPADKYGKGEINIGDLLHSALRLRPDRIVVGEVRGGECFFLLQAMNTGHGGTLTTAHANTPVDTLRRLEMLCLLSGIEMPLRAVRAQVASAVHLVICCERLPDGTRKLTSVSEVLPLDDAGDYKVQDLYVFEHDERGPDGEVLGHYLPTGILPTFFPKLRANGIDLPASFFDPASLGRAPPKIFSAGLGNRTQWAKDQRAPGQAPAGAVTLRAAPSAVEVPIELALAELLPDDEPLRIPPPPGAPDRNESGEFPSEAPMIPRESAAHASGKITEEFVAAAAPLAPELKPAPGKEDAYEPTDPGSHPPPEIEIVPKALVKLAPASAGKPRAPGAVRSTTVPTPAPPTSGPEKKKVPPSHPAAAALSPLPAQQPGAIIAAPRPSSIEIEPELAAEIAASMPYESTLITRNPLLDRDPPAQKRVAGLADEDTNPGARRRR
jgi:pilus assembly protein CpaF